MKCRISRSSSAVSEPLWYATGDADEFSRSTFRGRLPLRYIYWRGCWTDTEWTRGKSVGVMEAYWVLARAGRSACPARPGDFFVAGVAGGRWQWLYGGWWQVNTDRRKAEPRRPRQNKRDNLTHPIGPIPIPSIAAPQHRHSPLHSPPSTPSTPLHSAPSGRLQASRQSTSASLTAYHTIHRHRLFRPAAVAVAALLSSPSLSSPRWVFRRSAPENTNPQCARA